MTAAPIQPLNQTPRHDLTLVRLRNTGASPAPIAPTLTIESASPIKPDAFRRRVQIGGLTSLTCSRAIVGMEQGAGRAVLRFPEAMIPPHGEQVLSFVVARGRDAGDLPVDLTQAEVAAAQGRAVLAQRGPALRPHASS